MGKRAMSKPSVRWETITVARARTLLKKTGRQRPISKARVARYVKEMLAGRWVQTGEPIHLSKSGHLLNGQHRLSAIVESGIPCDMVVIEGVPDDAILHMDTGGKRSIGDILGIYLGVENPKSVASTLTQYLIINAQGNSKPSNSTEDYLAAYAKHEADVKWAIATIGSRLEGGGVPISSGCGPIWGAFAYMRKRNPQLVEKLAVRFKTMKGIKARDNARVLRAVVGSNANKGSQEIRRDLLSAALQCIDAELGGRSVSIKNLDSGRAVFNKIRSKTRTAAAPRKTK